MTNLSEFLLDRIAEDEAVARAATNGPWQHNARTEWHTDPQRLATARRGWHVPGGEEFVGAADGIICVAATGPSDERQSMLDAAHIARWDPARVLAECEAKRRLVALHRLGGSYTPGSDRAEGFDYCATCGSGEPYEYPTHWPCPTLRILALPYAQHPDYDQAWRP